MNDKATLSSLEKEIETLEKSRRRMLLSVALFMLVWFVPQILESLGPETFPRGLRALFAVLGAVGGIVWMVLMLRFHRLQTKVRNRPELQERLNDERVRQLRREAVYRGWVTMVVLVAVGVALAPFVEIPGQPLLMTLLLVGVEAPILFFLWLDRG